MSKLTYQKRKRMRDSSFALEKERKYPIDTIARGRNALARVAQHGTPAEQAEVRREVYAKYPSLRPDNPEVTKPKAVARHKMTYGAGKSINFVEYEYNGERYITGTVVRGTDKSLGWYFGKGTEGLKEANRIALLSDEEFSKAEDLAKYSWAKTRATLSEVAIPKAKVSKPKVADIIMGEVILYGGLPMTRANVYRQALKDTGSAKAADMFAFGSHIKLAPEGTVPFTLAEFREVTKPSLTRSGSVRITPKRPRIR